MILLHVKILYNREKINTKLCIFAAPCSPFELVVLIIWPTRVPSPTSTHNPCTYWVLITYSSFLNTLNNKKNLLTHQSTECKEPHEGTGSQQLHHRRREEDRENPDQTSLKVSERESKIDKHSHTSRTWAYLQAYDVDQRLVGDVDLAQDLGNWHLGDQPVERHKQREDWSEPVREER